MIRYFLRNPYYQKREPPIERSLSGHGCAKYGLLPSGLYRRPWNLPRSGDACITSRALPPIGNWECRNIPSPCPEDTPAFSIVVLSYKGNIKYVSLSTRRAILSRAIYFSRERKKRPHFPRIATLVGRQRDFRQIRCSPFFNYTTSINEMHMPRWSESSEKSDTWR